MTNTKSSQKRRGASRELKVVFDTNILHNESPNQLLRLEVKELLKKPAIPDLPIKWLLPDIVRQEREFQMRKSAVKLIPSASNLVALMGLDIRFNLETVQARIGELVSSQMKEIGLIPLPLDSSKVHWDTVVNDAASRKPPFIDEKGNEKGFRDAVLAETFLQLVAASPTTPATTILTLISNDDLLCEAVGLRTAGTRNVRILRNIGELQGLINTLASQVDEDTIKKYRAVAEKLFFTQGENTGLYFKLSVREKIHSEFASILESFPADAPFADGGPAYSIYPPIFIRKESQRISWSSRIEVKQNATSIRPGIFESFEYDTLLGGSMTDFGALTGGLTLPVKSVLTPYSLGEFQNKLTALPIKLSSTNLGTSLQSPKKFTGTMQFNVLWSVTLNMKSQFIKPTLDGLESLTSTWASVSQ